MNFHIKTPYKLNIIIINNKHNNNKYNVKKNKCSFFVEPTSSLVKGESSKYDYYLRYCVKFCYKTRESAT